jgi:hypothetical protein
MGCDQVSPVPEQEPPVVLDFALSPDSVTADDLDPDQVQDSLAQVTVTMAARVQDPDGTVERVVFTIEPSLNPRGTATGTLVRQPEEENVYVQRVGLQVPSFIDEVYTVRVFAVDNDSLESNQGLGQFRFLPSSS